MASGSSERGLSDVSTTSSARSVCHRAHLRALAGVTVAPAAEYAEHTPAAGHRPGGVQGDLEAGRGMGVVDQHRHRAARADQLHAAGDRRGPDSPAATRSSSTPRRAGGRHQGVLDVEPAGQREFHPRPRQVNRVPPTASSTSVASSGRTAVVGKRAPGGRREFEQSLAPGVVGGARHGGSGRGEQGGLRLEIGLHRPVVVEVVTAEVGETATSNTMASTRCWVSAWEDTSIATARMPSDTIPGQGALQIRRLGSRPRPTQRALPPRWAGRPPRAPTRTSWVTVVFPLVPVTPTVFRGAGGWPETRQPPTPSPAGSSPGATRTWVTPEIAEVLAEEGPSPRGPLRRRRGRDRRCARRGRSRTVRPPRRVGCRIDRGHHRRRDLPADLGHGHIVEQVGHHHHVGIRGVSVGSAGRSEDPTHLGPFRDRSGGHGHTARAAHGRRRGSRGGRGGGGDAEVVEGVGHDRGEHRGSHGATVDRRGAVQDDDADSTGCWAGAKPAKDPM